MIVGDILLIIEGLAMILICILDFPPNIFDIYALDCGFAIFAIIFGTIMLIVGIRSLKTNIQSSSNPTPSNKEVNDK